MAETNGNRGSNDAGKRISLTTMLWPLAMSAYAIFRLTCHGHLSTLSTIWYLCLAIAGGVLTLMALCVRSLPTPKEAGKQCNDLCRNVYAAVAHRRRQVEEKLITEYKLDLDFYRRSTDQLESLHFSKVADYIDAHLEQTIQWSRAVIRGFISSDGATMAAVYDVRFLGWYRVLQFVGLLSRNLRTVEFETELSDGSFVTTSNATYAAKASEFPGISRRFFDKTMRPAELYDKHRQHVRDVTAQRQDITPLVLRTFGDLCAAQDRQDQIKSRHRNSADFDPVADIAKISGKPLTPEQQEMADHTAELHAQRVHGKE